MDSLENGFIGKWIHWKMEELKMDGLKNGFIEKIIY